MSFITATMNEKMLMDTGLAGDGNKNTAAALNPFFTLSDDIYV